MTTLYTVQCNFTRPDLEEEWNRWYSGPKTAHMLDKPMFLRSQRFVAHDLDVDVRYLAMWELESPAALETPEYRATWGWDRWAPMIVDWVRDLSTAHDPSTRVPYPVHVDGPTYIHLAWFDQDVDTVQGGDDASAASPDDWWWGTCGGLDASARAVAVRTVPAWTSSPLDRAFPGRAVRETVYRPVSAVVQAPVVHEVGA